MRNRDATLLKKIVKYADEAALTGSLDIAELMKNSECRMMNSSFITHHSSLAKMMNLENQNG